MNVNQKWSRHNPAWCNKSWWSLDLGHNACPRVRVRSILKTFYCMRTRRLHTVAVNSDPAPAIWLEQPLRRCNKEQLQDGKHNSVLLISPFACEHTSLICRRLNCCSDSPLSSNGILRNVGSILSGVRMANPTTGANEPAVNNSMFDNPADARVVC